MRRHGLTAVTLVQNEARWLPEWLEYHLLPAISVEHFYLYDDDATGPGSTDGLVATLAPYRRFVTLHRVSELGPMPTSGEKMGASDMRMCSETPPASFQLPPCRRQVREGFLSLPAASRSHPTCCRRLRPPLTSYAAHRRRRIHYSYPHGGRSIYRRYEPSGRVA